MTANQPYFTIIIPTYNRAQLIGMTLKSVLTQTFTDFEVIVVDDGGNDHTEAVVKAFESNKVQYLKKENGERGAARNYGWQRAKGQYVTFLDSDDILYPVHLECAFDFISQLNKEDKPKCFAQAYEIRRAQNNHLLVKAFQSKQSIINSEIIKGNILSCFGVFLKKELFDDVRFEEDRHFAGTEDWLLWLQLAARYPFYYNNCVTGALLEHESRSVLSFNEQSLLYRAGFLKRKLENDDFFLKVYGNNIIRNVYAHMLSYTSLHLAMSGNKRLAFRYLIKTVRLNAFEAFQRRTLGIIKNCILN
jgi:glycosyltransferase involved in cell wall biosynthesis